MDISFYFLKSFTIFWIMIYLSWPSNYYFRMKLTSSSLVIYPTCVKEYLLIIVYNSLHKISLKSNLNSDLLE